NLLDDGSRIEDAVRDAIGIKSRAAQLVTA
ncbi:MAG: hypothetical protein RLZZ112_132, partial [Verrucomicrobiota bacterium]